MAAHASAWSNSLNRRRRGGKRNTMVMMFVGGIVLMFEGFFVLFLPFIIYGAGVFRSRPNPYGGKAVNNILMNILVTLIYFILIITWSLAYGCGQQRNRRDKKYRQIDDNFDGHGDAAEQRGAHHPMAHIQGFTRSNWMLPSGKCLRHIAPRATMVDEFE
jgi:hypothetical protein